MLYIFQYSCLECNLFDDEDKSQFHCAECEICRVGGAERFFHCKRCNICLPLQLKNNGHKVLNALLLGWFFILFFILVCRKCIACKLSRMLGIHPHFKKSVPRAHLRASFTQNVLRTTAP